MKNNIASLLAPSLTISVLLFMLFTSNKAIELKNDSERAFESICITDEALSPTDDLALLNGDKNYSPYLGKTYLGFKEALGFKESGGDYFTVNTYGYLGKYQFGKETLKMIGIYNPKEFLDTPELQEKAFLANAERNKWILRRDIKRFVGLKMNGVLITESGILAAAHLSGPGSVKKYLRSYGSERFVDAYGTSIQNYMERFSGYDTSFVKPNRKAKVDIATV